uniref:(northern house mosquito) hypothetical protein n=1 Tax=Culex pipiens TaxID=7175 RepID=A0A8D8PE90_CULPI
MRFPLMVGWFRNLSLSTGYVCQQGLQNFTQAVHPPPVLIQLVGPRKLQTLSAVKTNRTSSSRFTRTSGTITSNAHAATSTQQSTTTTDFVALQTRSFTPFHRGGFSTVRNVLW